MKCKWKTEPGKKTGSSLRLLRRQLTFRLSVFTNSSPQKRGVLEETGKKQLPHYYKNMASKHPKKTQRAPTDKKCLSRVWWPRWRYRGPDFLLHLQVKLLQEVPQENVREPVACPSAFPGSCPPKWMCRQALSKTVSFSVLKASGLVQLRSRSRSFERTTVQLSSNSTKKTRQVITQGTLQTTNKCCNPCLQRH